MQTMSKPQPRPQWGLLPSSGFSLPELLMVLLILAEISAFTIPKILTSQQNVQKRTVFRESIAAMNEALHMGLLNNEVDDTNFGTYMLTHINAVKICTVNANSTGCWPAGNNLAGQGTTSGLVFHNGAMWAGLDDWSNGSGADTTILDWNGASGSNIEGVDQLIISAYMTDTLTSDRVGTMRVNPTSFPGSKDLWVEIFQ